MPNYRKISADIRSGKISFADAAKEYSEDRFSIGVAVS